MKSTASIPNQPITWLTAPVEGQKRKPIPVITTQEESGEGMRLLVRTSLMMCFAFH